MGFPGSNLHYCFVTVSLNNFKKQKNKYNKILNNVQSCSRKASKFVEGKGSSGSCLPVYKWKASYII